MERTRASEVQVLDRAVSVLNALQGGSLTLAELVVQTGLARATAHRLAIALEVHGLVARDERGRFLLGPTLGCLAAAGGASLATLAAPALEELRSRTEESVQLYVRSGDERICIVALESPHSLRTIVPVGAVLPLARGSAGRALTAPADSRGAGWFESVEEREPGVASVSAAVVDRRRGEPGQVVAAVSVSGPVERTTRNPGARYGEAVRLAAARLEQAAGYLMA